MVFKLLSCKIYKLISPNIFYSEEVTQAIESVPTETISFENTNYEAPTETLKDEPTWQQRAQQPPRQVYRNNAAGGAAPNTNSYKKSQRYQRNFENRRQPPVQPGTYLIIMGFFHSNLQSG